MRSRIIENYGELRIALDAKGFISRAIPTPKSWLTSSETANCVAGAPWSQVVAWSLKVDESAYGVVFMFQDDPDFLVWARKGSPLILVSAMVRTCSRATARIVEHSRDAVYVREGEPVIARRGRY